MGHDPLGESGRRAGGPRRGLLRAAVHGGGVPGAGRPAGERPGETQGDDLLLLSGRVKAAEFAVAAVGPSEVAVDPSGEVLTPCGRDDLGKLE